MATDGASLNSTPEYVIIANPTAGRGRTKRLADDVAARLRSAGRRVEIRWTQFAGHAQQIANEAVAAGVPTVVACGGDGTVQQVAQALAQTDTTLGLAPGGRCDDFARAIGVGSGPGRVAQILLEGAVRRVDLGRVGDRFFCSLAAIGFDAAVSRFVDQMRLPIKGNPAYVYGIFRMLLHYRFVPLRLTGEFGERAGAVFLAAIGNTSTYGGGICISPRARLDDGLLDICLIRGVVSKVRVTRLLPLAMHGRHGTCKEVEFLRTKTLRLESPRPLELWADGEFIGATPLTVEAVPRALKVLAPV